MIKAPCKNCEDRKIVDSYTCHTECPKWTSYITARDKKYKMREIASKHLGDLSHGYERGHKCSGK